MFSIGAPDGEEASTGDFNRLSKILSHRYEDRKMESKLTKKGYSCLLQHLLDHVIRGYKSAAAAEPGGGDTAQRSLLSDLEEA